MNKPLARLRMGVQPRSTPAGGSADDGGRDVQDRVAAFEAAEASLVLEGLCPSGELYARIRADVIAGRMSFEEAVGEIARSFGPDAE